FPTTTQRDADALAWCLRHGAQQEVLADYLHTPLADDERRLLNVLFDVLAPVEVDGLEILVAAAESEQYVDGVSNLAHKLVDLTDCRGLLLLIAMDGRVFCVVRSRVPEFDAAALARALGGGGHAEAASAIVRDELESV